MNLRIPTGKGFSSLEMLIERNSFNAIEIAIVRGLVAQLQTIPGVEATLKHACRVRILQEETIAIQEVINQAAKRRFNQKVRY